MSNLNIVPLRVILNPIALGSPVYARFRSLFNSAALVTGSWQA